MHYWQLSPLTRHAGLALLHSSPGRHRHAPVPVIVLQQHPAPWLVILHDLREKKYDEKRNANDLENSQMVSFPALFRSRVGQCRPSEPPSPSCHWEKIQDNNNYVNDKRNDPNWPTEDLDSGHETRERVDQVGRQFPLASLVQYPEIIPDHHHDSNQQNSPPSANYPTQFNSHRFDIIIFLRAERIAKLIGTQERDGRRRNYEKKIYLSFRKSSSSPVWKLYWKCWKTLRLAEHRGWC